MNKLENWVNEFSSIRTSCSMMNQLAELVFEIRREDWISTAFEVFNEVNGIIRRKGYQMMAVLTFPLNFSDHEMKAPSKFSLNVMNKYISPGIILTRVSQEKYIAENKCIHIPRYEIPNQPYKFYYSQYLSYGDYRRSIDIIMPDCCFESVTVDCCRIHDMKLEYLLEAWINNFIMNPKELGADDIDYFIRNIKRDNWIAASWDIYRIVNDIIVRNGYPVNSVLTFMLKCSNSKRTPPLKLSTAVLHKYTPPGITLIRTTSENWLMGQNCIPVHEYDRSSAYRFYYCQSWIDGSYSRSIEVFAKWMQ